VTYPGNGQAVFTWNALRVPEVTHYEIGIRSGNTIVAFTTAQLETITTAIADIEGVEVVNGIIRIDKSSLGCLPPRLELNLGRGFQANLALRAAVVNDLGVVVDNSANAVRAVNVRR